MNSKVIIKFILVIFAVFCAENLFSQQDTTRIIINKIYVQGNRQLANKELERYFSKKSFSRSEVSQILKKIAESYLDNSFPFAQITANADSGNIKIKIEEGSRLILKDIFISTSDSLIEAALNDLLDLRNREEISLTVFQNAENLLGYLENHGYPFATVQIDSFAIENSPDENEAFLDIYLQVIPGARVYLDEIHISGNKLTKENVIIRESRIKKGELYKEDKVARIPERLMKTGFFTSVKKPRIAIDENGKGHLLLEMQEGNPNQMNAVIGYTPANNRDEKGYFTGLVDLNFRNLLGTGRAVQTYWQKKDRRSQELRFHYAEPWILGYPVHAGFGFEQTIRDTTYVRRAAGFDIDMGFSDLLTLHSHLGKESVIPDSLGQILFGIPKFSAILARLGFSYDTRDNPWNPISGVFYKTEYELAQKKVSSLTDLAADSIESGSFRRTKIEMDAELYVTPFRHQTILLAMHGRQVKSNERKLSYADLYRLGGTKTLRGYLEDEFLGERIAWLNLEYRYLLGQLSRAFLFFDAGYIMRKMEDLQLMKQRKYSFGFGFRIETRLGIIGVDYGIGQGRGIAGGLVHVGLTNKF